jgi:hypothetical protein
MKMYIAALRAGSRNVVCVSLIRIKDIYKISVKHYACGGCDEI